MTTHLFGFKDWTFQYSHSIGRQEYGGTGFRFNVDLAMGANDTIYVVNRSQPTRLDGVHVTVATIDERYHTEFGSYGEADGQFIWPTAIALDSQENVYVADEWLNRISVFTKEGQFTRKWGKPGSAAGEIDGPAGLAISQDGTVFLSDSKNHRIQKFTLDGEYRGQFGGLGSGPGQFNLPWGICLDQDELVYVADWRNDRIQQSTPDGKWLASFGASGSEVGQFNRPNGVCVDRDGLIYVTDWLNNRVQILNQQGRFIAQLQGDNLLSPWAKEKLASNPDMVKQRALAYAWDPSFEKRLRLPSAVRVDDQGRIVVSDPSNGRLQVYVKRSSAVLA